MISKHLFEENIFSDIMEKDVLNRILFDMCTHVEIYTVKQKHTILHSLKKEWTIVDLTCSIIYKRYQ